MDNKVIKNQIYRLTIEGYTSDGSGIARADGFVVFVPFSARGDVLDVKIVKVLKTHAFGVIEQVIEPSGARIEPDTSTTIAIAIDSTLLLLFPKGSLGRAAATTRSASPKTAT